MSFLKFFLCAVFLGSIVLFGFQATPLYGSGPVPELYPLIVLANFLITCIIYKWIRLSPDGHSFTYRYLFTIVLKLVFNVSLLLIIAILLNAALSAAAILVLVCHLSFTALNTSVLFYQVNR
jgi:hypothetical protein